MTPRQAVANHANGCNCAQAVLFALCGGEQIDRHTAALIAGGFGGGISGTGNMCGALSGAIMAVGLRFGQDTVGRTDSRKQLYALVRKLCDAFRQRHASLDCRDLLKMDLANDAAYARAVALGVKSRCGMLVHSATELVEALLPAPQTTEEKP